MRPEIRYLLVIVLLFAGIRPVVAAGFAASVSPPRFELKGNPGDVLRDHVDIQNPDNQSATFLLRTADWSMNEAGSATFYPPELQPGSCRPWSRIERHKILVPPKGSKRFRFEIAIPKDAPVGECRLALLIEAPPDEAVVTQANSLTIPVQARVAVVIYVEVGDAAPDLILKGFTMDDYNGQRTPMAILQNRGTAHARPTGFLDAVDSTGERLEFQLIPMPILPGQTRKIPLQQAVMKDETTQRVKAPLQLKGTIEWNGEKLKIDQRVE
jgi:fimbrial chaperone protein